MRDFARENNIDFWEGKGVFHQVMIENYVRPGELIFGADVYKRQLCVSESVKLLDSCGGAVFGAEEEVVF